MRQHQQGFTLVELMVAMAIGTVIILGAGQLFLTTFQTFQTVDKVSRKQENLIFIAQRVTGEIRQHGPGRYSLRCEPDQDRCNCTVADQDESGQPLVSFFKDITDDDLSAHCAEEEHVLGERVPGDAPLYRVALPLENNGEPIVFHVTHRDEVLATSATGPNGTESDVSGEVDDGEEGGNDTNTPDPNNPGYYMDGGQMYNNSCYVPGNGNLNTNRNGCDAP